MEELEVEAAAESPEPSESENLWTSTPMQTDSISTPIQADMISTPIQPDRISTPIQSDITSTQDNSDIGSATKVFCFVDFIFSLI